MKPRPRKSLGKVKKTSSGTLYNPQTKTEYKKVDGGYIMIRDKELMKWFNNELSRLRRLDKKHGGMDKDIDYIKALKDDYTKSIDAFNRGFTARPETVQKREKLLTESVLSTREQYAPSSKSKWLKDLTKKNKIARTRMLGEHEVRNEKEYDRIIKKGASLLGLSNNEFESLLYPTQANEKSEYIDIKEHQKQNEPTIKSILNERVKNGDIGKSDASNFLKEIGMK